MLETSEASFTMLKKVFIFCKWKDGTDLLESIYGREKRFSWLGPVKLTGRCQGRKGWASQMGNFLGIGPYMNNKLAEVEISRMKKEGCIKMNVSMNRYVVCDKVPCCKTFTFFTK